MKKIIFSLLSILIFASFASINVNASKEKFNLDEVILYFEDVEYACTTSNGDDDKFVALILEIGKNNYLNNLTGSLYSTHNSMSVLSSDEHYTIFGIPLTQSEIMLLILLPNKVLDWKNSAEKAMSKTTELYGPNSDGSIANSFQHAYWNVLMVKKIGLSAAKAFANAHEDYDGNPFIHMEMDLYNNKKGRDFASLLSNLDDLSDDFLAALTQSLVTNGDLIYIIHNYQYLKKMHIYEDRIEFEYDYGNFHSYTNMSKPISLPPIIIVDYRPYPGPIPTPNSIKNEYSGYVA